MRTITIALTALLLAGCASTTGTTGNDAQNAAPTPAGAASPKDPALGATHTIRDPIGTAKAAALTYRQPLRSMFPPDRKGYTFAGVDTRLCLPEISGDGRVYVSWMPWSLEYADDTVVEPVSSWSDDWFRVQLYPGFDRVVREGGCVRGWIVFEVPKGKRPVRVVYAPDSGEATAPAVWTIR